MDIKFEMYGRSPANSHGLITVLVVHKNARVPCNQ